MKIQTNDLNHKARLGFTLIEMIGVLAVIAILAALLIPKVFSAINDARVNNTCVSTETIKTAVVDHYGKYGKLNSLFGTNDITSLPITNYCAQILMPEALIDKPYYAKIAGGDPSTNSVIQLVAASASTPPASGAFALDGGTASTTTNGMVIQAVLYSVSAQDAKDLNDRIDGPALGSGVGQTDAKGRVQYSGADPTTVYIYITHR
jgi:prepilin-type N-terminal cleavage/methylation domain-containing protein